MVTAATFVSSRTGDCAAMPRSVASSGLISTRGSGVLARSVGNERCCPWQKVDGLGRGQGERIVPDHLRAEPGFARGEVRQRRVAPFLKRDGVDLHQPRARVESLLQVLAVARFPGHGQPARMVLQLGHGDPGGLQHVVQRRLPVTVPEVLVEAHPAREVEEDVGVGAAFELRRHHRRPVLHPRARGGPLVEGALHVPVLPRRRGWQEEVGVPPRRGLVEVGLYVQVQLLERAPSPERMAVGHDDVAAETEEALDGIGLALQHGAVHLVGLHPAGGHGPQRPGVEAEPASVPAPWKGTCVHPCR